MKTTCKFLTRLILSNSNRTSSRNDASKNEHGEQTGSSIYVVFKRPVPKEELESKKVHVLTLDNKIIKVKRSYKKFLTIFDSNTFKVGLSADELWLILRYLKTIKKKGLTRIKVGDSLTDTQRELFTEFLKKHSIDCLEHLRQASRPFLNRQAHKQFVGAISLFIREQAS